jgi:HEAT repeat protein
MLSPAERERIEVLDRLLATGQVGVDELVARLSEPAWAVRRAVIAALASLGDEALPALLGVLTKDRRDETVLAAAVDALVASTGAVAEAIAPLAKAEDPAIVADVAQVLGRRIDPQGLPVLVRLTQHPNDNVAVAAIEGLGRTGGRAAVEPLIAAVGSGNFFRVFPAIDVLGRSGDPRAVEPLTALLGNRHYALEATRALGRTGDRNAVAPLGRMLVAGTLPDARVAALAIADLRARYEARFATVTPIEESLRGAVDPRAATRRLDQAIASAEGAERAAIATVLGMLRDDAAVPALMRLLSDRAPAVGEAAAEALRSIGRESGEAILAAIRAGDPRHRKLLLPLLSAAPVTDDVETCLQDADPEVRAAACEALARIGNPAAVPALFAALEDPNPGVVQSAVAAIQSLGSPDTERRAIEAARSPNPSVRRWGLRILAYFGSSAALDVCLEGLADEDPRVRDSAIYGLPFIDDVRAKEALFELARAPVPRTRSAAVRALGQIPNDARVQAVLLRALTDPDPWVRYYGCQSLGRVGAEAAAEPVARLLADEAGQVRVSAVEALSHFTSQVAHDALVTAARAEDDDVRRAALVGLGMMKRPESLPALLEATRSTETATRLVALSALAPFDGSEVTAALASAASDPDEGIRSAAIGFLAGRPGREATTVLIDLLRRSPASPRLHQAVALPTPERIPGIFEALRTADDELAPLLTSALARMGRADAMTVLARVMSLPHVPARKAAAMTLAGLGTREALDTLMGAAAADPDPEVRRICSLVLV